MWTFVINTREEWEEAEGRNRRWQAIPKMNAVDENENFLSHTNPNKHWMWRWMRNQNVLQSASELYDVIDLMLRKRRLISMIAEVNYDDEEVVKVKDNLGKSSTSLPHDITLKVSSFCLLQDFPVHSWLKSARFICFLVLFMIIHYLRLPLHAERQLGLTQAELVWKFCLSPSPAYKFESGGGERRFSGEDDEKNVCEAIFFPVREALPPRQCL